MNWLWKFPDHIQHSIIAAGMMLIFSLPWWALGWSHPAIMGAIPGIMFFYGREKRDSENHDPTLYDIMRGLWPPLWRRDDRSDFYWPAATSAMLAVLIETLT